MQAAKTLIRLGGYPGRSESSLGAHWLCWFCHEEAQIRLGTASLLNNYPRIGNEKNSSPIGSLRSCCKFLERMVPWEKQIWSVSDEKFCGIKIIFHKTKVKTCVACNVQIKTWLAKTTCNSALLFAEPFLAITLNSCFNISDIRAASSEFVSSSIPSWQILTAHAQPFRGARDLAFCLKVPHHAAHIIIGKQNMLDWTITLCQYDLYVSISVFVKWIIRAAVIHSIYPRVERSAHGGSHPPRI